MAKVPSSKKIKKYAEAYINVPYADVYDLLTCEDRLRADFKSKDEEEKYYIEKYGMPEIDKARKIVAANNRSNPICNFGDCNIRERTQLNYCSTCRLVYYCSGSHQRADWPAHKMRCCNIHADKNVGKTRMIIFRLPQ
jgi:hypothetical protein